MSLRVFWQFVALLRAQFAQKASKTGPKYDAANQVKIKGVIDDIHDILAP